MPHGPQPICFQCGQQATETARFNRLEDGRPCPACSERLLATLRPLLPGYDPTLEPELSPLDAARDALGQLDDDQPA